MVTEGMEPRLRKLKNAFTVILFFPKIVVSQFSTNPAKVLEKS